MKKNISKCLALGLTGVLSVSTMAGCGSATQTAAGGTTKSTAAANTKESTSAASSSAASSSAKAESTSGGSYDVDNMNFNNVKLKVCFRFSNSATDGQGTWYYKKLAEFNKKYQGKIQVSDESISTESDYLNKISTDFASGDAPNAFVQYGGSRTAEYVNAGYVLDLTPYFKQYPDWYNGVQKFAWETTKFDGKSGIYGMPWSSYQLIMYYNKPMLEKAGIKQVPESWDDLLAACKTLKAQGNQPFDYSDKDNYHFEHLMSAMALKTYGLSIRDDLKSGSENYGGKKMTAIYQKMKDMIDAGYWGKSILSTDVATERSEFEAGKTAFFIDGTWEAGNFQNETNDLFKNKEIGAARVPYIDAAQKTTEMGGGSDTYYVSTLNKTPEEIAATVVFVKYLTNTDAINEMCKSSPTTYAEKVTIDTGNYLLNDINDITSKNTESSLEIPDYDSNTSAMDTIRASLQALATGSSAEKVAKDIVDTMSKYQ